jgi:membrane protease YdiL (CAAX protease family)
VSVEETTPPPARRNYTGWVALAIMFALLITLSLFASTRPRKAEEAQYTTQEMQLRLAASQIQLLSVLPRSNGDAVTAREQVRDSLSETVSDLIPEANKTPDAARLYAAMRTEQGRKVAPEPLNVLQASKDPIDQTFARIYGTDKLSADEAKRLASQLPDRPFLNLIAQVHALEKGGDKTARADRISPWVSVRMFVAAMVGFGLLALSLVVWTVYLAGRRSGKYTPRGHPIGRVTLHDADRLAIRGAQILGAFFGLQIVVEFLGSRGISLGQASSVVLGIGILVIVALLALLPVDGKRISLANLGLTFDRFGKNLVWGIAGFIAELPITGTLALIGIGLFRFLPSPSHPATEQVLHSENLVSVLPILLFGSIIAPIWEEILFRGILFPAIGRTTAKVLTGALVSSLLFGLIHPQGPSLVLALAGVGAVSCGLAYQTRSLIPSIVMHMLHNTATFTLLLLMM